MSDGRRAICRGCWEEFEVLPGEGPPPTHCPDCASAATEPEFAPEASTALDQLLEAEVWREGDRLAMQKMEELPEACVRCNAPAEDPPISMTVFWHHPAIYLLCLGGPLVYLIGAVASRKRAPLRIPVCARHRAHRRNLVIATWALVVLGFAAFILGTREESEVLLWTGLIAWTVAFVPGILASRRPLFAVKMDYDYVWLKGACPAYLARLPDEPPAITGM